MDIAIILISLTVVSILFLIKSLIIGVGLWLIGQMIVLMAVISMGSVMSFCLATWFILPDLIYQVGLSTMAFIGVLMTLWDMGKRKLKGKVIRSIEWEELYILLEVIIGTYTLEEAQDRMVELHQA